MTKRPIVDDAVRAARLSRLPGVTIAEAAARFGVPKGTVARARRELPAETTLSLDDQLLAALSKQGRVRSGTLGELADLASWIDYLNHDGCNAAEIRRMLAGLARDGRIALSGDRWRLLVRWP